jgi:ribose transport system substrate-binding protein
VNRSGRRLARVAGIVCVAVIAIATLEACGSGSSSSTASSGAGTTVADTASGKPVQVGMFLVDTTNTYSQAELKAAKRAAAQLGNVKVQAFFASTDANKQVQQLQTAAATGRYNGLIVMPIDGARVVPAITQAGAKGIKVACVFSVCGPDQSKFANEMPKQVVSQTGIDAGDGGAEMATQVNKACAGKNPCNVVVMLGYTQLASQKTWDTALTARLAENVKIVATGQGQFVADPSYKVVKDILQAHPDVDVITSVGDQMTVGAEQAVDEAGLKGKVKLLSSGAGAISTKAVKDGRWAATAIYRPQNDGYLAMKYLVEALRGQKVPPLTNTQKDPRYPSGFITADTAASWTPEWPG